MCGLAGLFILPDFPPPLPDFNLALSAMKHRGPDDEGFLDFNWLHTFLNQKKYSYLPLRNYLILANGLKNKILVVKLLKKSLLNVRNRRNIYSIR
jgi:asparagine synthetase B (glutamine-hydrolysing)